MQGPAQEPQPTALPGTEVIASSATGNYGEPIGVAPVAAPPEMPPIPNFQPNFGPNGNQVPASPDYNPAAAQAAPAAPSPESQTPLAAPGSEPAFTPPSAQAVETQRAWSPNAQGPDVAPTQAPALVQTQPIEAPTSEPPQPDLSASISAPPTAPQSPFLGAPQNLSPDVAPPMTIPPTQQEQPTGAWQGPAAPSAPAPSPQPETFITVPQPTPTPAEAASTPPPLTTENPFGKPTTLGPDVASETQVNSESRPMKLDALKEPIRDVLRKQPDLQAVMLEVNKALTEGGPNGGRLDPEEADVWTSAFEEELAERIGRNPQQNTQ